MWLMENKTCTSACRKLAGSLKCADEDQNYFSLALAPSYSVSPSLLCNGLGDNRYDSSGAR
jgi:hypothetical protein